MACSNQITVGYMLEEWRKKFKNFNVPQPVDSAAHIITYALNCKKISDINHFTSVVLSQNEENLINCLCARRLKRMPIPYITGEWKFHGVVLNMSPPVFIPMIETEKTVDLALEAIDSKRADTVLELCCGSGAISLAILKARPQLEMIAVDKSDDACKLTKENADALKLSNRLKIIKTCITNTGQILGVTQKFDVIVSNPPSVPINDIEELGPEFTQYMDLEAVNGGDDGLNMIKVVSNVSSKMLKVGGRLVLEINPILCALIEPWLKDNQKLGLSVLRWFKDFNDLDRYVEIVKR